MLVRLICCYSAAVICCTDACVAQDYPNRPLRIVTSEAGGGNDLHARLVANLRLGMSVFLHGNLKNAQELLAQKVLFRDLERAYADSHLSRLAGNTIESIETSSLHLDLIADLDRKSTRLNSSHTSVSRMPSSA